MEEKRMEELEKLIKEQEDRMEAEGLDYGLWQLNSEWMKLKNELEILENKINKEKSSKNQNDKNDSSKDKKMEENEKSKRKEELESLIKEQEDRMEAEGLDYGLWQLNSEWMKLKNELEILENKTNKEKSSKNQKDKNDSSKDQKNEKDSSKNKETTDKNKEATDTLRKAIKAKIINYEEIQRQMWARGGDNLSEEEKKEFNRINDVLPTLKELLNKDNLSLKDIKARIYDLQKEAKDMWTQIVGTGEIATPEEETKISKLGDIARELQSFTKTKTKEQQAKDDSTSPKKDDNKGNDNKDDEQTAKDSGYAEGGFQPPAVVEKQPPAVVEKQPPAVLENQFPTLDLNINKKTGVVTLIENGGKNHPYITFMDSYDYTRNGLKFWKKEIQRNEKIASEDVKYLDFVDPTIYNAYLTWDRRNQGKYDKSATDMYVKSVITRAKDLEKGQKLGEVELPGKINVDIGWHNAKNQRPSHMEGFKKLTNLMASFRANKILKAHNQKNMNLAEVKDNRWKRTTIAGLLSAVAIGTGILSLNSGKHEKVAETETPIESQIPEITPSQMPSKEPIITENEVIVKQDKVEEKAAETETPIESQMPEAAPSQMASKAPGATESQTAVEQDKTEEKQEKQVEDQTSATTQNSNTQTSQNNNSVETNKDDTKDVPATETEEYQAQKSNGTENEEYQAQKSNGTENEEYQAQKSNGTEDGEYQKQSENNIRELEQLIEQVDRVGLDRIREPEQLIEQVDRIKEPEPIINTPQPKYDGEER